MPPEYVVIGHITKDLTPEGYTIGGTATYAALTARNLGLSVGIVTSFDPGFDPNSILEDISITRIPASETTTFQNLYHNGRREQFIHGVAASIDPAAVPVTWRRSPIIHLGPLVREIPSEILSIFDSHSLIGVTPQGWMRQWDESGRVAPRHWHEADGVLRRADALVFSVEDVARMRSEIDRLAELAQIMVVTRGPAGATLFLAGDRCGRSSDRVTHHPAFEATEMDPTGAGDVFAAAFLIRLHETDDPHEATRFANAVASLSIEGPGVQGIPTRAQVEHRLHHGRIRKIRYE
ncbi:MAG: PfkB family carbohydrate kinase [Anaerolineae bacterium]